MKLPLLALLVIGTAITTSDPHPPQQSVWVCWGCDVSLPEWLTPDEITDVRVLVPFGTTVDLPEPVRFK